MTTDNFQPLTEVDSTLPAMLNRGPMRISIPALIISVLLVAWSPASWAQGLQACLALQYKNPGVRDPLRDLLTSDFRCSVPSWAPRIFLLGDDPGVVFHSACLIHDLCYKHGSYTYEYSRKTCDDEFRDRMNRTCAARYQDENQLRCRVDAGTIYEVVRKVGFLFYLSPPGFNDFPEGIDPFTNDHGRVCRYLD